MNNSILKKLIFISIMLLNIFCKLFANESFEKFNEHTAYIWLEKAIKNMKNPDSVKESYIQRYKKLLHNTSKFIKKNLTGEKNINILETETKELNFHLKNPIVAPEEWIQIYQNSMLQLDILICIMECVKYHKINKNYPEYPYLLPENVKYVLKENGFLIKTENNILSYGYKHMINI